MPYAGLSIPPEFAQLAAMYGSNPSTAPSMDYSGFAMSPPGETSPSQAPGGSSDYADEESGSSSSFAFNPIPLAPYVEEYNLSLPSEFLLIEQAFRCAIFSFLPQLGICRTPHNFSSMHDGMSQLA